MEIAEWGVGEDRVAVERVYCFAIKSALDDRGERELYLP